MRVPPFYVSNYVSFYAPFFCREHPIIRTCGAHLPTVDSPAFHHLNMAAALFLLCSVSAVPVLSFFPLNCKMLLLPSCFQGFHFLCFRKFTNMSLIMHLLENSMVYSASLIHKFVSLTKFKGGFWPFFQTSSLWSPS